MLCVGAVAVSRRFFGESGLDTIISNVQCTGNEAELVDCNSSTMLCSSQQRDAGVVCQAITTVSDNCSDGDVRLVNGSNVLEGRVEMCLNNAWGTVCDTFFSEDLADIICNQTGYRHNGK